MSNWSTVIFIYNVIDDNYLDHVKKINKRYLKEDHIQLLDSSKPTWSKTEVVYCCSANYFDVLPTLIEAYKNKGILEYPDHFKIAFNYGEEKWELLNFYGIKKYLNDSLKEDDIQHMWDEEWIKEWKEIIK